MKVKVSGSRGGPRPGPPSDSSPTPGTSRTRVTRPGACAGAAHLRAVAFTTKAADSAVPKRQRRPGAGGERKRVPWTQTSVPPPRPPRPGEAEAATSGERGTNGSASAPKPPPPSRPAGSGQGETAGAPLPGPIVSESQTVAAAGGGAEVAKKAQGEARGGGAAARGASHAATAEEKTAAGDHEREEGDAALTGGPEPAAAALGERPKRESASAAEASAVKSIGGGLHKGSMKADPARYQGGGAPNIHTRNPHSKPLNTHGSKRGPTHKAAEAKQARL